VYGLIGGRSIGMHTGTAPAVLVSKFGLDVEHIDQSEIIRRAKLVGKKFDRSILAENHVGEIFDGLVSPKNSNSRSAAGLPFGDDRSVLVSSSVSGAIMS
jgi:hypothetical protein